MKVKERYLEDMIWDAINKEGGFRELKERGLRLSDKYMWLRQHDFGGGYGRGDIIGFRLYKRMIDIHILELKADIIGFGALEQAIRYARGCQRTIKTIFSSEYKDYSLMNLKITLIGKRIEQGNSFPYVNKVLDNVDYYTYDFDAFKGIVFNDDYSFVSSDDSNINDPNFTITAIKNLIKTNEII